jgi:hypothetical protein
MTLTIAPEIEAQLVSVAQQEGIDPTALVAHLVTERFQQRVAKDEEYTRRIKLLKEIIEETEELGLYE